MVILRGSTLSVENFVCDTHDNAAKITSKLTTILNGIFVVTDYIFVQNSVISIYISTLFSTLITIITRLNKKNHELDYSISSKDFVL